MEKVWKKGVEKIVEKRVEKLVWNMSGKEFGRGVCKMSVENTVEKVWGKRVKVWKSVMMIVEKESMERVEKVWKKGAENECVKD